MLCTALLFTICRYSFPTLLISNLSRSRSRRRFLSSFPAATISTANNATAKASHTKDEAYLNAVIEERIKLFESIKEQISLSNGTVKEGERRLSSPMDIAKGISKSLASNALISQFNCSLWDMNSSNNYDYLLRFIALLVLYFREREGGAAAKHRRSLPASISTPTPKMSLAADIDNAKAAESRCSLPTRKPLLIP